MLRIAHVVSTPSGLGGAEGLIRSLVAFGQKRDDSQLVLNPFGSSDSLLAQSVEELTTYKALPCDSVSHLPRVRRQIQHELKRFRADVVHAHLFHAQVLVGSMTLDIPKVVTHHHGGLFAALGQRGRSTLDRWSLRRYDRVVAVSHSVARFLTTSGIDSQTVLTIHNGWEGRPQRRAPESGVIVCIANFRTEKDHVTLLRAFAKVLANEPAARLRLLGEGSLESELRDEVRRLGIKDSVEFRGRSSNVWKELSRANVFALPSLIEPFGIAVLEAMAAGVPVVATRTGGIPEIVEHERTGLLVEPRDSDGMAVALLGLLQDEPRARAMGAQGRKAASEFRMSETTARYFQLYEQLAS